MGELGSVVDSLLAEPIRDLPDELLQEEVVEIRRQINRLEAGYLQRVEVIDRRGQVAAQHHGSTAAWLRRELRLAPAKASKDMHLARDLEDVLPSVGAALADGDTSVEHCQVLAGLRKDLTDEQVRAADPHLADLARTWDPGELRGAMTAIRHSYAKEKVAKDEQSAYDERRLHMSKTLYGTGVGNWQADPVSQELIMTAIHAASRPVPNDDRTPAQRRFDGLLELARRSLNSGDLPDSGGVKPHVSVVVPLDTLQDNDGAPTATTGYGQQISGEAARRIACDAEISRIITGPGGEILDSGRATRTFTAAQRRAINARDGNRCIGEGCDVPAAWCDCHHVLHWARDNGPTSVDNGVTLCGRHHDQVHHHGHAIITLPDGRKAIDPRPGSDPNYRGASDNQRH
jgi:hypothetical protein